MSDDTKNDTTENTEIEATVIEAETPKIDPRNLPEHMDPIQLLEVWRSAPKLPAKSGKTTNARVFGAFYDTHEDAVTDIMVENSGDKVTLNNQFDCIVGLQDLDTDTGGHLSAVGMRPAEMYKRAKDKVNKSFLEQSFAARIVRGKIVTGLLAVPKKKKDETTEQ